MHQVHVRLAADKQELFVQVNLEELLAHTRCTAWSERVEVQERRSLPLQRQALIPCTCFAHTSGCIVREGTSQVQTNKTLRLITNYDSPNCLTPTYNYIIFAVVNIRENSLQKK